MGATGNDVTLSVKALKGGTLIDGTGARPLRDSVIVIQDSKITEVGEAGQVRIPAGAEVINAGGSVVMPGLIDCHTHIGLVMTPSPNTGWGVLEYSSADTVIKAVAAAKNLIEAGVTTIRNCADCRGSGKHVDISVRDAIKQGVIIGPRVFASDSGITITGGHGDLLKTVRKITMDGQEEAYGIADGVAECVKLVREQVKAGADFIKIFATGGAMEAVERAGTQEMSDEEISGIVKEAGRLGRFVAAHAVGPPDAIRFCSEAGVRSIEHGVFSDEGALSVMREKGTYLVPTLGAYHLLTEDAFPELTRQVARRAVVAHENTLKMAKKVGANIALGTDSGSPYGSIHGKVQALELELMVSKGLTEMEAIMAATKTAAECIGIGHQTGTIEPGKLADLIVVEGDPLSNIGVLKDLSRIKAVIKDGVTCVARP